MVFNKAFKFIQRKALLRGANIIAKAARRNAAFSSRIVKSIKVGDIRESNNGMSIDVYADLEIAPEARAFEKGSGIHGDSGQTYPITPRGEGYPLRFYWEKVGEEVRFMKVNHPGVKGIHYLENAMIEHADDFVFRLANLTVESMKDGFGVTVERI